MSRTRRIGQARLFALLAVLLGLLAMHGLASTHHAVAETPVPSATAAHAPAAMGHEQHVAAKMHLAEPSPGGGLSEPLCTDDCPDALTMLCVAVLTNAVAAAVLIIRRSRAAAATPWHQQHECRPAPVDRPPDTLDPVAELCISRT